MAVTYEYTEEMMNQLNAIRGDKTAFRKLRRQFRKELGLHSNSSSKGVKVTSDGEELKEVKGLVNGQPVSCENETEEQECVKVESETEKEYTTDDGDVITIVAG